MNQSKQKNFGALAEDLQQSIDLSCVPYSCRIVACSHLIQVFPTVATMLTYSVLQTVMHFAENNQLMVYVDFEHQYVAIH